MEPNQPVPDPNSTTAPQSDAPTTQPTSTDQTEIQTPPQRSNKFITILAGIVILGLLSATAYFAYSYYQLKNQPTVNSFEECAALESSTIQLSSPRVCHTTNGQRFVQQLSDDENESLISPESDSISAWQTYSNEKYGYSLKYPQTQMMLCEDFSNDEVASFFSTTAYTTCPTLFQMDTFSDMFVRVYAAAEYQQKLNPTSTKQIEVGSKSATHYQYQYDNNHGPLSGITTQEVVIPLDEYVLVLNLKGNDQQLLDQILSTFEFTDVERPNSSDTSDWQTCQNENLNLTFKYDPDAWQCNSFEPSETDGTITLTSQRFQFTSSNMGRGGPCGQGPDIICNETPFYSNDILTTKLYTSPGEKGEIFGQFSNDVWISIFPINGDHTLDQLSSSEKAELTTILSTFQFLD